MGKQSKKHITMNLPITKKASMSCIKNLGFIKAKTLEENPNATTMVVDGKSMPIKSIAKEMKVAEGSANEGNSDALIQGAKDSAPTFTGTDAMADAINPPKDAAAKAYNKYN